MENTDKLKEALGISLYRCRKFFLPFPPKHDIRMSELTVMKHIAESVPGDCVYISDLQKNLFISKPAVSQILGSLEKKGYIQRYAYHHDRRKLVVILTPKGQEILADLEEYTDRTISVIISRFGEENTAKLIELIDLFADISDEVRNDMDFTKKATI